MARRQSVLRLGTASLGLFVWAAQFTLVYMITAAICTRDQSSAAILTPAVVPWAISATTLIAFGATVLVLLAAYLAGPKAEGSTEPTDRFFNTLTLSVSAMSLLAIAWTGLPALIVPACG